MNLTVKKAAAKLGICPERVRQLCKQGKLPGATKHGRDWSIPAAALEVARNRPRLVKGKAR